MEDLELLAFKIISGVGSARSFYIEAIAAAKGGRRTSSGRERRVSWKAIIPI